MNNFERGSNPKKEIGIGIEEALKNAGIVFNKVMGESGFFSKEIKEDGKVLFPGSLNSYTFSPKELRLIADFLEAYPECSIIPSV